MTNIKESAHSAAWQIFEEIGLSKHSVDRVSEIIAEKMREQKAIDEELRLSKCNALTQEECDREAAFAEWYRENGKGTPTYSDAIEWARKEVIDKACDWLDIYLMKIGYPDDWLRDSPNIEGGRKRFIKAMEK